MVADLWCGMQFLPGEDAVTGDQYNAVTQLLGRPQELRRATKKAGIARALERARSQDVQCLHWELEFPEVFFSGATRKRAQGFDVVIGNPPYDVLSELETGRDLVFLRAFLSTVRPVGDRGGDSPYAASVRGKNNLYKLFICRSLELLKDGGRLGLITPMAILGDDQAAGVRRLIFAEGAFTGVESFPQKDDASRRVFPEAKLSTAAFHLFKTTDAVAKNAQFRSRVHPAQYIEDTSPSLLLSTRELELYDPENLAVVSCDQADWDLVVRLTTNSRVGRLRRYAEFFQGEVNETNERRRGCFTATGEGQLVVRGASICLYIHREASQGTDLWLNTDRFLEGKGPDTKAYHHRWPRVALQESSPQNNFRGLIAAAVPAGEFFNHTVNYTTSRHCRLPLNVLLGLLNSKVSDWYFRLGSTNAHVSHYQLYNLPCPLFDDQPVLPDEWRHCEEGVQRRGLEPVTRAGSRID